MHTTAACTSLAASALILAIATGVQGQESAYYSQKFGGRYTASDFTFNDELRSQESTQRGSNAQVIETVRPSYQAGVKGGQRAEAKWQPYPIWKTLDGVTFSDLPPTAYKKPEVSSVGNAYSSSRERSEGNIFERNNNRNSDSMVANYDGKPSLTESQEPAVYQNYNPKLSTPIQRSQYHERAESSPPQQYSDSESTTSQQPETTTGRPRTTEELLSIHFLGHNPDESTTPTLHHSTTSYPVYSSTVHRFSSYRTTLPAETYETNNPKVNPPTTHETYRASPEVHNPQSADAMTHNYEGGMPQIVGHLPDYKPVDVQSEYMMPTLINSSPEEGVNYTWPMESLTGGRANVAPTQNLTDNPTPTEQPEEVYHSTKVTPLCRLPTKLKDSAGEDNAQEHYVRKMTEFLNCGGDDTNPPVQTGVENKTKPIEQPHRSNVFDAMTEEEKKLYFKDLEEQIKKELFDDNTKTEAVASQQNTFMKDQTFQENQNVYNANSQQQTTFEVTKEEVQPIQSVPNGEYQNDSTLQGGESHFDTTTRKNEESPSTDMPKNDDTQSETDTLITNQAKEPTGSGAEKQSDETPGSIATVLDENSNKFIPEDEKQESVHTVKVESPVPASTVPVAEDHTRSVPIFNAENKYFFITEPKIVDTQGASNENQETLKESNAMSQSKEQLKDTSDNVNSENNNASREGELHYISEMETEKHVNLTTEEKVLDQSNLDNLPLASLRLSKKFEEEKRIESSEGNDQKLLETVGLHQDNAHSESSSDLENTQKNLNEHSNQEELHNTFQVFSLEDAEQPKNEQDVNKSSELGGNDYQQKTDFLKPREDQTFPKIDTMESDVSSASNDNSPKVVNNGDLVQSKEEVNVVTELVTNVDVQKEESLKKKVDQNSRFINHEKQIIGDSWSVQQKEQSNEDQHSQEVMSLDSSEIRDEAKQTIATQNEDQQTVEVNNHETGYKQDLEPDTSQQSESSPGIQRGVQSTEANHDLSFEDQNTEKVQLLQEVQKHVLDSQASEDQIKLDSGNVQFQIPNEWDVEGKDLDSNNRAEENSDQKKEGNKQTFISLLGTRNEDSTVEETGAPVVNNTDSSELPRRPKPIVNVVTEISVHHTSENSDKKRVTSTESSGNFFTQAGKAITDYFSKPWEYVKSVFTHS